MNKPTLTALNKSIKHWERMATGKAKGNEFPHTDQCALCDKFVVAGCEGCPVSKKTGDDYCSGTPYSEAFDMYRSFGIESKQFQRAARKELSFLRSLLPKRKTRTKK